MHLQQEDFLEEEQSQLNQQAVGVFLEVHNQLNQLNLQQEVLEVHNQLNQLNQQQEVFLEPQNQLNPLSLPTVEVASLEVQLLKMQVLLPQLDQPMPNLS
mgnify:CR=1 FL=1